VKGEVVLASGLWMPAAATALIAARLARAGYATRSFAYSGRQPFEANVERLAAFVQENYAGRAAHFVGHSLGGVLLYDMLERHREVAAGRVVLLGAPVRGCHAGRRLGSWSIGRWMLGGCAARWEARDAVWRRPEALGVIAATVPLGLGRALGALPGENDGVVCVAETELEGMADRALVRTAHSTLAFSARVARLIEQFLSAGRFS
jgi:pimeloyl-ACP methyl ester carboxylesterase